MRVVFLLVIKFYMSQKVHTSLEEKTTNTIKSFTLRRAMSTMKQNPQTFIFGKQNTFFH